MPIKGWTDADPRLPRLGSIGLGIKKGGEKSPPVAVDYFVLPDDVQHQLEEFMGITQQIEEETKAIEAMKVDNLRFVKGLTSEQKKAKAQEIAQREKEVNDRENALAELRKIRELDVVLPDENIEAIMPAWLKRYNKNGLICKGDGQKAGIAKDYMDYLTDAGKSEYGLRCKNGVYYTQDGEKVPVEHRGGKEWLQVECIPQSCPFYNNPDSYKKSCREVAILSVILSRLPGVLGVYSLDTGSYNSYQNIKNSLEMLRKMLGRVSMVPLKLRVKMQFIKKFNRNVPILFLDFGDMNLEQVIEMVQKNQLTAKVAHLGTAAAFKMEDDDEDHAPGLLYSNINQDDADNEPQGGSEKEAKQQEQVSENNTSASAETEQKKETQTPAETQQKKADQLEKQQKAQHEKTKSQSSQENGNVVEFKVSKVAPVKSAAGTDLLRMIIETKEGEPIQVVAPVVDGVEPGKVFRAVIVKKAGHNFCESLEAVS